MNNITKLLLLSFLGVNIINCGGDADLIGVGELQNEQAATLNRQISEDNRVESHPSTPVNPGLRIRVMQGVEGSAEQNMIDRIARERAEQEKEVLNDHDSQ
jgi:hypothetical protein